MEIWGDIKGFEGKYQVSTEGNVRSLNYNNTGKMKNLKKKINKYGFAEVKLSKNNKAKDYMVARLVAEKFIPNPSKKPKVMHISIDKLDDSVENLKWAYDSEIKFNMYKKGSRKIGTPTDNKISYKGKAYKSYSSLARAYGIDGHNFLKRMARGWTLEEALEIPLNEGGGGRPYFYNYYGKDMTLDQISKLTHIEKKVINKRLNRGWSLYEAAEIPKQLKGVKNGEV